MASQGSLWNSTTCKPTARKSTARNSALVLALDVGTSSVRCLACDTSGYPVRGLEASRSHETRATPDGGSELEAERLLAAAMDCLAEVSRAAMDRKLEILAVGVCTFWHAFLAVAPSAKPLTPIYLWNDTRASNQARTLANRVDGAAVHRRTGCVIHPSYLPARLEWLRESRPELFHQGIRFLSFGEYLELKLFGSSRIGLSMASGTGLLNQETLAWDEELLSLLRISREALSPLCESHAPMRGLTDFAKGRLPLLGEIPFFPALGDGACSNLGSGATRPQFGALNIGTSAAARIFFPRHAPPPVRGLWRYLLDGERGLLGGALSNGGNLIEWLQRTLRLPPMAKLESRLAEAEPASHGLTLLPFLTGERNPDYPLDASGVIAGLRQGTTPAEIVQAAMESVAFRLAAIVKLLREVHPELQGFILSGGAARSRVWPGMLADILGMPVNLSTTMEASARGAALMALEALGEIPEAHPLPPPLGRRIDPEPRRHERYLQAQSAHEALYAKFIDPGI